jgi:hypothetical protein
VTRFFVSRGGARRVVRGWLGLYPSRDERAWCAQEKEAMKLWQFVLGGGPAMWFVLLFGSFTLAAAIGFARRPDARRADAVRSFSWATAFSIASGVCLNLATVGSQVPANLELAGSPKLPLIVMVGIAESLAPAILGFMLLSLAWTVMAVGHRRLSHETPA